MFDEVEVEKKKKTGLCEQARGLGLQSGTKCIISIGGVTQQAGTKCIGLPTMFTST